MDRDLRSRLIQRFAWREDELGRMQDLSGIYRDPGLINRLGGALAELHPPQGVSLVVSPQSQGWILGPLVAVSLGVGFVRVHKEIRGGDIADGVFARTTPPDYKSRGLTLSIQRRLLAKSDVVLMVDDWVQTGAQAGTVRKIVEDAGAEFAGVACLVDGAESGTRRRLLVKGLLRVEEIM